MQKLRFLFADLDCTLLDSEKNVSSRTLAEISCLREKEGIHFGVATGRDSATVFPLLKRTGLDKVTDVAVMNNGVDTCLFHGNEWIRFPYVSKKQIRLLIDYYGKSPDFTLGFHNKDVFYATKAIPKAIDIQKRNGRKQLLDPTVYEDYQDTPRVLVMSDDGKPFCNAFFTYAKARRFAGLRSMLSEPNIYEYICERVTKLCGIHAYVSRTGGKISEVIAFGDSDNDVEMLRECGIGIAMPNSTVAAKQAAKEILNASSDEDGIYQYLRSHANLFRGNASE